MHHDATSTNASEVRFAQFKVGKSRLHMGISEGELYAFLAVLFMSHLTNISMSGTSTLFIELAYNPPTESLHGPFN